MEIVSFEEDIIILPSYKVEIISYDIYNYKIFINCEEYNKSTLNNIILWVIDNYNISLLIESFINEINVNNIKCKVCKLINNEMLNYYYSTLDRNLDYYEISTIDIFKYINFSILALYELARKYNNITFNKKLLTCLLKIYYLYEQLPVILIDYANFYFHNTNDYKKHNIFKHFKGDNRYGALLFNFLYDELFFYDYSFIQISYY